ncbi:MAG: SGNH/GDSL hydrolase family protein [Armatimonadetes bacterium]|nr:SGNH/GDSL hydrolase family protein [Armatimonadota bacterium]
MIHPTEWSTVLALVVGAVLLARPSQCRAEELDEAAIFARSLVTAGDTARLQHALAKARRGEQVLVSVIGGSITQGAAASKPENRYGESIAAWWRQTFPNTKVEFVNAGIGATGSNYGALRAQRDLLSHKPDFVVAEYGVNDGNTQACAETLEGLTRQILTQPNQPALVLLFTMNNAGGNAQEWHGKVGTHYALPMVSFRDALWPEIEAKRLKWEDVEGDVVHPNDRGHAYCAHFVTSLLEKVLKELPADDQLLPIKPVPQPLFSDLYEHVALFEADALKPVTNEGWTCDLENPWAKGWKSDKPGSVIEFELEGQVIAFMEFHVRGPMGTAKVQVDDLPPATIDAWFDQTWGGWRCTHEIARDLKPGKHRVRVEILEEKNPESEGPEFRVLGLGAAGVTGG